MKRIIYAFFIAVGFCFNAFALEVFSFDTPYDVTPSNLFDGEPVREHCGDYYHYCMKYILEYGNTETKLFRMSYNQLGQACKDGWLHAYEAYTGKNKYMIDQELNDGLNDICSALATDVFKCVTSMSRDEMYDAHDVSMENQEYAETYGRIFVNSCRAYQPLVAREYNIYKAQDIKCDAKTDRCVIQTLWENSSGGIANQTLCCWASNGVFVENGVPTGGFAVKRTSGAVFYDSSLKQVYLSDFDNECQLKQ